MSIGFYNQNEDRDYPFVDMDDDAGLPHAVIVDCGFIVGPDARFETGTSLIWLHSLTRAAGITTLIFHSSALGLTESLTFSFDDADGEYATEYALVSSSEDPQKWEGFVTIGRPWKVLGDTVSLAFADGERQVEKTLIHNLLDRVVTGIQCANTQRVQATAPVVCLEGGSLSGGSSSLSIDDEAYAVGPVFTGDVKLKPGYNCRIDVRARDNSIIIGGQVGGGEGPTCEDVARYEGDEPPSDSEYRSGGPSCASLIKSINGIVGPVVELKAGPGFRITEGDDPHSIRITADTIR